MLWLVLLNIKLAFMALANRLAYSDQHLATWHRTPTYLNRNLLLVFAREIDKMVILCANQERDGGLVEPPALAVPFLDRIESALPGEIEHEQNGNSVVTHQRKHVDKLPLATKIPDRKGNFRIADGDCLFHEVDPFGRSVDITRQADIQTHLRFECSPRPSYPRHI